MIKKIKLKIFIFSSFILFFGSILMPNNLLASNCCEISTITVGNNGSVSNPVNSCKDDADVNKETCVNKTISNANSNANQTAVFFENSACNKETNKCGAGTATTTEKKVELRPINFKFNIPLPGLPQSFLVDSNLLPTYIIWLFKFVVGMAGMLAVFMITVGGLMWIFAGGNGAKIGKAKEYILGAIIGLSLAIFSYSILYIINPQLTANKFPEIMNVQKASIITMDSADYERLTGGKILSNPEIIALARQMAKKLKTDYCALYTILATESGGNPLAISFDENVKGNQYPARVKFVNKNGCKQTHGGGVVGSCSIFGSAMNDDSCLMFYNKAFCTKDESYYRDKFKNCDRDDLCLDWRYTHGIGMFQTTFWLPCTVSGKSTMCVKAGDKQFTPKELLKVENQMAWFAANWSSGYCPPGTTIEKCWENFAGPGSGGIPKKVATYNECKKSN